MSGSAIFCDENRRVQVFKITSWHSSVRLYQREVFIDFTYGGLEVRSDFE